MLTLTDEQTLEILTHFNVRPSDFEIDGKTEVTIDGQEYLVLTDDDADAECAERIKDSLWAFNYHFLAAHSKAISAMGEKAFRAIQEQCESANDAVEAMVDDLDALIEDAIACDGRGHFLSGYDGEETEVAGLYFYAQ